jgi:hypothetical protein
MIVSCVHLYLQVQTQCHVVLKPKISSKLLFTSHYSVVGGPVFGTFLVVAISCPTLGILHEV